MNDLEIVVETAKESMDELRGALDSALHEQFPGGMLRRQWNGEVLELSGPGAQGTIVYDGGRLVGQAALKPPASMMRGLIEQKISAALRKAAV
jgi:hypothetical protein